MSTIAPIPHPQRPKVRAPQGPGYEKIKKMLHDLKLVTVCQEAICPNIGECWGPKNHQSKGTATFMLLGDTCTRACKFCAVKTGNPQGVVDEHEPQKIGQAIAQMELDYVVLTSVDRDDLPDEGAEHFARTIWVIKKDNPKMLVEALTPDFSARYELLEKIIRARVDVFAHNIETVEDLTPKVRDRRSTYQKSLLTLKRIKEIRPDQYTKSSIMLGHGETPTQVAKALADLRAVQCDVVTFGQYLRPTARHLPVVEYIPESVFQEYQELAESMGFLYVASGPLVRSSYRAGEYFLKGVIEKNS